MVLLKLDIQGTKELTKAIHEICERYGIAPHKIEQIRYGKQFATITLKDKI